MTWREAQALLEERAAKEKEPIDVVGAHVKNDVREEHERHLAARERWEEVEALPQLFLGGLPR